MEYLPKFAACRDIGHVWYYSTWHSGKRTLDCANCTTTRTDIIDQFGRITSRVYKYPKDYHYKSTPKVIRQLRLQLEKEARKLDLRWIGQRQVTGLKLIRKRA